MNIDQFLQPPYTIPAKYFLLYFKSNQIEKACCEIRYSFDLCINLCTKEFIQFVIENGLDSIFCTIAYSLHSQNLTINQLLNPDFFLTACSKSNAYVIAIIYKQCGIKISPLSNDRNEKSALKNILDRDDPDLLIKCLKCIPEFSETEENKVDSMYYILEHHLNNLIEEIWIFIENFKISKSGILEICRNWKKYSSEPLIPILEEIYKEHMYEYTSIIENYRYKNSSEIAKYLIEPTELNDINCIDFRRRLIEADKLRTFLAERHKKMENLDQYNLYIVFDPKSPTLLYNLPYELMKDVNFFLNYDLYMKKSLVGEEATGEGPVQNIFNAYFNQIMSSNPYFNSDEYSISILPTYKSDNLRETKNIFYGLGIVLLKVLIDMRFIGNFHEKNKPDELKGSLHPWIFQAILQKMETDPKKLFYQALVFDRQYFNPLYSEKEKGIDYIIDVIKKNMMYLQSRGVYYQALHDGFYLNYVDGVTPSEFKNNLKTIKKELSDFYKFIQNISPETIHFLLVGSSYIDVDYLLTFFEFKPWEKYDSSGNGDDKSIIFVGNDFHKDKMFRNSIQYFTQTMKDWCNEEYQEKIRDFLRYLTDVPTLSPLNREKWEIAFDFSIEKNSIIYAWNCSRSFRAPLFDSVENCKDIILRTLENYKKDPTHRDIVDVEKMEEME